MKIILFIAFLLLSNYGICQFTSMIDVAKGKWDYQRSGVAASILTALEKGEPEVAMLFFKNKQKIKIKELTNVSNLIAKLDTIPPGFPPVYINEDTLKNTLEYQRIYYRRAGSKREYLFQVNIFLDGNEFNLKADSIKYYKSPNVDSITYLLEMIKCGNYPPGPPAHEGLYDWKNKKIIKPYKSIKLVGSEKIADELLNMSSYRLYVNIQTRNIPDKIFWNSSAIESLEISAKWDTLPAEIGNLMNLKWLKLEAGSFKVIPKELGKLVNLQGLEIRSENLQFLPETIGNLIELEELKINAINLNEFPNSLANLVKLKKLTLFYTTKIPSFPAEMGKLSNLAEMRIWSCDSIPKIINPIKSVQKLYLNDVKNINEVVNFTGLKELKTFGCTIKEFPLKINNLKELEKIEIAGYGFKAFPETFAELENIKTIILYSGSLETFPTKLNSAKSITHIFIDGGKIANIPETINEFQNLRNLSLKFNTIEEFPSVLFDLPNLKWVNLSNNKILKLPDNIETINSANFFELTLSNNPIDLSGLKNKKLPFKLVTK